MAIGMLKNAFILFGLSSITLSAEAGSSATAITTISANIVPAASFSVIEPVLLRQGTSQSAGSSQHHTAISNHGDHVIPSSVEPAKLKINSSQNLIYDVSLPSAVGISGNEGGASTRIGYSSSKNNAQVQNKEVLLEIDAAVSSDKTPKTGTYQGLFDITVNYN